MACGRFLFLSISPVRLLRAPSYKESSKSSQVEHIQYALSLTGMLARPSCGCLGTVNVAVVGELSPNTGRASDFKMPGFHHADGRGLQLATATGVQGERNWEMIIY